MSSRDDSSQVSPHGVPGVHARAMRVLDASGRSNIALVGARQHPLTDLYHRLLSMPWPVLIALLGLFYVSANAMFATLYVLGGDVIEHARPHSFLDAFFFSIQTMATIGYGTMAPRGLYANSLVALESLVGLLGFAVATGLMYSKFAQPRARVLFSNVALVTRREGMPCLIFRMANQRANQLVEAHLRAVIATNSFTAEGEPIRRVEDLRFLRSESPVFAFSWTAIHPIDELSPLNGLSAAELAERDAEIIVVLSGIDDTFSQTVHARRSYVAAEIVWNARFVDVLSVSADGRRSVDLTRFHDVVPVGAPQ